MRPGDGHEELEAIPVPTFIDTTDPELATGRRRPAGHPLGPGPPAVAGPVRSAGRG